jgi:hypothetical protein
LSLLVKDPEAAKVSREIAAVDEVGNDSLFDEMSVHIRA